jgi:hypothetical protein
MTPMCHHMYLVTHVRDKLGVVNAAPTGTQLIAQRFPRHQNGLHASLRLRHST